MSPAQKIASGCQARHVHHDTVRLEIKMGGPSRVPDYPAVPERFAQTFPFEVYDSPKYNGFNAYCPGQDETSRSFLAHGIWEGFETLLALDIMSGAKGSVLDFGAHIGWYSILAARAGLKVRAFEAEPEHARVLLKNAKLNKAVERIRVDVGFVGPDSPPIPQGDIAFLKCDVEGQEDIIVAKCQRLFERRRIRAAMLEISPCFARHYPETCAFIAGCGYSVHDIPDKGDVDLAAFSADPLGGTRAREIARDDIAPTIAAMHQRNWLFLARTR